MNVNRNSHSSTEVNNPFLFFSLLMFVCYIGVFLFYLFDVLASISSDYEMRYFGTLEIFESACIQALFFICCSVVLSIRAQLINALNAKEGFVRNVFILLLPALVLSIIHLFLVGSLINVEYEYIPRLMTVLIYLPALLYVLSGKLASIRKNWRSIALISLVLYICLKNINLGLNVWHIKIHDPLFAFFICVAVVRCLLYGRQMNGFADGRGRKRCLIVMLSGFLVSVAILVFGYYYETSAKYRQPVIGMSLTPDWSPHDNRIIFTAYKIDRPLAFRAPKGKILIVNAETGKNEKVLELDGGPSIRGGVNILYDIAWPLVSWSFQKDTLFYMKNGNEGVIVKVNTGRAETIFNLPKGEYLDTNLVISPDNSKVFFVASKYYITIQPAFLFNSMTSLKTTPKYDEKNIRGRFIQDHLEYSGYIVELKSRKLHKVEIRGFKNTGSCMSVPGLEFTGWFSNDILALDLPDCSQECYAEYADKNAPLCGTDTMTLCPKSKGRVKILIDLEGKCLGNYSYDYGSFPRLVLRGDGRTIVRLVNYDDGSSPCLFIEDVIDKTILKSGCLDFSLISNHSDQPEAFNLRRNTQAKGAYNSDNWIWMSLSNKQLSMPILINYKTAEVSPVFAQADSLTEKFSLLGMPSVSGEYHVLSTYGNVASKGTIPYIRYTIFNDLLLSTANLSHDSRSDLYNEHSIYNNHGDIVRKITVEDFDF